MVLADDERIDAIPHRAIHPVTRPLLIRLCNSGGESLHDPLFRQTERNIDRLVHLVDCDHDLSLSTARREFNVGINFMCSQALRAP